MDPLTHTLVGASLSATRLGETTRRAVPALVIGANLPDIDVLAYIAGDDVALGFRRGWTHGVLALLVLPAVLALVLWLWDWRRPGKAPPDLSPRWLFALSYIAVLTHPVLDWLNTYGVRWLMPFDGTWFYGDSVFIMDPWLWLALGTGWLVGRRRGLGLLIAWGVISTLLVLLAALRAPHYAPAVVMVLLVLLLALLRRPVERPLARRFAGGGLALAALFIGGMLALHEVTEHRVRNDLQRLGVTTTDQLMVGPVALNPLAWEFVVSSEGQLRHGEVSYLRGGELKMSGFQQGDARQTRTWHAIHETGQIPGFLGWARFPWIEPGIDDQRDSVRVFDARYTREASWGFGSAYVDLSQGKSPP